jgi:hypothetical protein
MSLVHTVTSLLTSLDANRIKGMSPKDRQLLSDQCQRVYQIIRTECIVDGARSATTGVLPELARFRREA